MSHDKRQCKHAYTAIDTSANPTDPFYFGRLDGARIDLISADPRLEVMLGAAGMLTMNGFISDDGPFDAFLAMKIDDNFVTAAFHKGMEKADFLEEIARCLPPGYEAASPASSEVLIVDIFRTPSRGGMPEVGFTCTDPSQRVRWAGKNKFIIEGRAARNLSIRSELQIEVEGRRIQVIVGSGDLPLATATRIRQVLPLGYTALIELPLFPGAEVVVTILRRHN